MKSLKSGRAPRILAGLAAIILFFTSAFHTTGYGELSRAVSGAPIEPFFRRAMPLIWLFFSWHLVALGIAASWAALRGYSSARPLLFFITAVICVDTAFVFSLAGIFAGTVLLATAALCLIVAAAKWTTP